MIRKLFGVVKILGAIFCGAATAAIIFTVFTILKSEDLFGMATVSILGIICCAYLRHSALRDIKDLPMKGNIPVWIGFGVCSLSAVAVFFYWGWSEKISFGVPLLIILIRDFFLLIRNKKELISQFPSQETTGESNIK